ncbi:MAG: phosphotransferase, partial [Duncaniella sp.]|nr:phosphotransferase [Duncaniella sp.]
LNTTRISYSEPLLQDDFDRMASFLGNIPAETFMYRDFQSRNVMVTENDEVKFIDFQGGRLGCGIYDLVSFVRQARAGFPESVKQKLKDIYYAEMSKYAPMSREEFEKLYRQFALLRSLQTLGAYGFRGRFERKPHFMKSIRPALKALDELISAPFDEYPYLMKVLRQMIDKELEELTVRVTSFSFKKGYPEDPSGNGGGYVFDCRAMDNPGRYEEFKRLTGRDEPVISFLEEKGEVTIFLDDCYRLVDRSVENYLKRGFTSLSVSFGCTGGQHRSLYCADKMAAHIKSKFPEVTVILNHREQGITEEL